MFDQLIHRIRCSLPTTCIVCGQSVSRDWGICNDCEYDLPRLGACCTRCGIELNGKLDEDSCCPSCQLSPPSIDSCNAAFPYVSPINRLVADFKFSARFDIGYSLSTILAKTFNAHYTEAAKPQLILPVPLHKKRLGVRGFNQAGEISRVLSKQSGIASPHWVLSKVRNTEPQTSMNSATARKANMRKAFKISSPGSLEGVTHIALVDDVVTTMATVETISRMLREQQCCRIDVWCLARASR